MGSKKTHEEWFVGVQQKFDYEEGGHRWFNAARWYPPINSTNRRYAESREEAERVLEYAYELWNGGHRYNENGERYETRPAGLVGVTTVHTKETDENMMIVKHIIQRRTVTEWETVEEESI